AERINELFESWLVDKNFTAEQAKILRLIKAQYIARKQLIDATIFEEPIFRQIGGLNRALQIFGEETLQGTLQELNQQVFTHQYQYAQ
ncbi:MAG: type I restriction-modification enzyme R subunit C-terminal domain-containing protein, partial [Patescibacteria group bacterium]|nr:type I restriction-modification enzyme R subunit C-terminal domain-containing protein [Patescibacteria group bacterium]